MMEKHICQFLRARIFISSLITRDTHFLSPLRVKSRTDGSKNANITDKIMEYELRNTAFSIAVFYFSKHPKAMYK